MSSAEQVAKAKLEAISCLYPAGIDDLSAELVVEGIARLSTSLLLQYMQVGFGKLTPEATLTQIEKIQTSKNVFCPELTEAALASNRHCIPPSVWEQWASLRAETVAMVLLTADFNRKKMEAVQDAQRSELYEEN